MALEDARMVAIVTLLSNRPKEVVLHSDATQFANVPGRRVVVIVVHAVGYCEVRPFHAKVLRMLVHQLVETVQTLLDFDLER